MQLHNNFELDNHFTVLATEAPSVGMAVQVNWICLLGATATIPMVTVCNKASRSRNVTSIVPLGAANTREQGKMAAAAVKIAVHSESKRQLSEMHLSKASNRQYILQYQR